MNENITITQLYEEFLESRIKPSSKYYELSHMAGEIRKSFNEELQEKTDKFCDLVYEMCAEEEKESFRIGFSMATQLLTDALYMKRIPEENWYSYFLFSTI